MTTNSNGNGRHQLLTSNHLVIEFMRFALWFLMFLFLATSMNGRFSRIESSSKINRDRVKRLEKHLNLPPFTVEP